MTEYYKNVDKSESQRIKDQARMHFKDMKETGGQKWKEFLAHIRLEEGNRSEKEIEDEALILLEGQMTKDLQEKQDKRMPYVIIPCPPYPLGVSDKDGNTVYRLVAYKP